MNIAIIPARGGSKRIPRKNFRNFGGRPMISYAIRAALDSELFTHVIVSTDDHEIAETAKTYGAKIPFIRPAELSDDLTPTVPVIKHSIEEVEALGWFADYVCCIYPAVPLIQGSDLIAAFQLLQNATSADYSFPITQFPSAIQRALRLDASSGATSPFYPEHELTRSQDLEPAFHDAGQFYWGTCKAWKENPRIHSSGVGLVIPSWRVVDIDTEEEWRRAEITYQMFLRVEESGDEFI
jgi:pseudaminic acid cytidylyltransferase